MQADPQGRCTEHQGKHNYGQNQCNSLTVDRVRAPFVLFVNHCEAP